MPASTLRQFAVESSAGSEFEVDADKGVIKGISLITSGIAARGHQVVHPDDEELEEKDQRKVSLEIDKKTLEQMLACAKAKKKLPVKWNHKSGADAVSGYLQNFRIVGSKLKGDWHLLKSHERFAHALELATEMPESLGLSVSFSGKDEAIGKRKFARCTELVSADLVASPAANPQGMFEAGAVDSDADGMAKPNTASNPTADPNQEFSLKDVMAGITALNKRFDDTDARIGAIENFHAELLEAGHELEEEEEEEAGAERPQQFTSLAEGLQYFEDRLQQFEDEREREQHEAAFGEFEGKVGRVIELNEQLKSDKEQLLSENRAMASALKELSAKTKTQVRFAAGSEPGTFKHELSEAPDGSNRAATEFEQRVAELVKGGKDEADATLFAVQEDEGRYRKHLEAIEGAPRSL